MKNLIISEIPLEEEPKKYSVSRLKTLNSCGEYYRLKYVELVKIASFSEATLMGSLCHDALEEYYGENQEESLIKLFERTALNTLKETGVVPHIFINSEEFRQVYNALLNLSKSYLSLYQRSHADYVGNFPIRKKDGGIALAPTSTKDWKVAEENLGLIQKRIEIDTYFQSINKDLVDISVSKSFSEAYSILFSYKTPAEIISTVAVELPISDYKNEIIYNPVPMPSNLGGEDQVLLNGYVDWIGYVNYKGKEKLAIVDYKSSKEELTPDKVQYNVQLYSYVYAYEYLTGETVDLIGIHNLRAGSLVLTPIDRNKMGIVLEALFTNHLLIKHKIFQKQIPDTSYAKCMNMYGKICPYLEFCYPDIYESNTGLKARSLEEAKVISKKAANEAETLTEKLSLIAEEFSLAV